MEINETNLQEQIIPRPIGRVKAQIVSKLKLGVKDVCVGVLIAVIVGLPFWITGGGFWIKIGGFFIALAFGGISLIGEPNRRIYNNVIKLLVFLISKRKFSGDEIDFLIPYSQVEEKYFKTKGGKYVAVIKVDGFNINNVLPSDQNHLIGSLANLFKGIPANTFITKIETPFVTESQQTYYDNLINDPKTSETRKRLLGQLKNKLENVSSEKNSFDSYFVVFHKTKKEDLETEIMYFMNKLEQANLNSERLLGKDLLKYLIHSCFPTIPTSAFELNLDYSKTNYAVDIFKEKIKTLKFSSRNFKNSENKKYYKIIAIDEFSTRTSMWWLSNIFNFPNTTSFMKFSIIPPLEATKLMDKAHSEMRQRASARNGNFKLTEGANQSLYIEALNELAKDVASKGEMLLSTNYYIMVSGISLSDLNANLRKTYDLLNASHIKFDNLNSRQLEAYLALTPNNTHSPFYDRNAIEIGALALGQSWPFTSEGFTDEEGDYIGTSDGGKPVFLDWFYRNGQKNRVASNSIFFGETGKGKSTLVKFFIKNSFARNNINYYVDPENEGEDLAKRLGGRYIDLSGAKNASGNIERLNPLQPFTSIVDEEVGIDRSSIEQHFKFIETWMMTLLYPSVTETVKQANYLKFAIKELYKNFKITEASINRAKNTDYPTISDLYNLLISLSKKKETKNDEFEKKEFFRDLAERMYDLTKKGSDGNLWDGHTTIENKGEHLVVFNIQTLYRGGNLRLINAQMYLILKYLESVVQENKVMNAKRSAKDRVKVDITVDEAHLLINKDNPAVLKFAYQMFKRIRKYDGQIRLVTQNIADFTGDESVIRETKGILNSTQFMFIFGLKSSDIKDLDTLLAQQGGLTDYEKAFLNIGNTHTAIMMNGSKFRTTVEFDYSIEEMKEWGWKE